MLAKPRRRRSGVAALPVESHWMPQHPVRGHHPSRFAAQRLAYTLHERDGDRRLAATGYPLVRRLCCEDLRQDRDQLRSIANAQLIRREAPVARQRRTLDHALAQRTEVTIGSRSDHEGAIARLEQLVGNDRWMRVAVTFRFASGDERVLCDV